MLRFSPTDTHWGRELPIYEYRCGDCGKKSSQFLRSMSETKSHICPHCGSGKVQRLVSRVTVLKPFMESLNKLPSFETLSDFDENDPKSVIDWTKRMRKEMGTEFGNALSDAETLMDAGVTPGDFAKANDE